jgi:hypothetical protein
MWNRLLMIVSVTMGCARDVEPTAIRIEDPDQHWHANGFVEMVTPLEPPTTPDGRDRITVWLKLPEGEAIASGPSLRYAAGTVADRVEYTGSEVTDVRGTRFVAGGIELFHVLRRDGSALSGHEWRRGDTRLERRAADLVASRADPPARERLRRNNDCASCHQHDRPPAVRADTAGPRRATDSSGLYQMLAVLSDLAPIDHHRPRELNVDSPYLHVDCPDGSAAQLHDDGRGVRRYVCADNGVPLGHVDIARARREGEPRALAVCQSRRYLMQHMTRDAREAFAPAFAACGL